MAVVVVANMPTQRRLNSAIPGTRSMLLGPGSCLDGVVPVRDIPDSVNPYSLESIASSTDLTLCQPQLHAVACTDWAVTVFKSGAVM
jgi:hypothetical protein